MKRKLYLKFAAVALALSMATPAFAESARDELAHAYRLIRSANHDYGGHKLIAEEELHAAGRDLGLDLEGHNDRHGEDQWDSDRRLAEARSLLHDARDRLEESDRNRVAAHVERAIKEVDLSLAAAAPAPSSAESARDELAHAYRLIRSANHDYGGHKLIAEEELHAAGRDLGLDLEGHNDRHGEDQWDSDRRLTEANRLLRDARDRLEESDRNRVAAHVEKAIKEMDRALAAR